MYKQNKNNASQYPTDPLNLEMTKTLKQFRKISLQKVKDHNAPKHNNAIHHNSGIYKTLISDWV